jgi:hypothetical protein
MGFNHKHHLKNILINGMYYLACFSVSVCHKNALGRGSACSGLISKLEQSTIYFLSMGFNYRHHIKNRLINGMYHLACLSVSGRRKNALGRGTSRSGLITKLEQSTIYFMSTGFNHRHHIKKYTD